MGHKIPAISIKNVNKDFLVGNNKVRILKDINLDIFPGEFVIIFGPSGCGKSTLLNTIIGLEKPTNGKIEIKNQNLYELNEDERARLRRERFGTVYQQPNWIKSLSVLENVAFPLHLGGMTTRRANKRARNILDMLGMLEYEKYTPTELSGGQQQKVVMARALATNPLIVIADEPTGNLDTTSAMDVMSVFKYINDESSRTTIMVSHNPEYETYATKVVKMRDGQIESIVEKRKVVLPERKSKDLLEMALEME